MSSSLLLHCSPPPPPPHRPSNPDRTSTKVVNRASSRISIGSFSSYPSCQGPSKTPLLKSRRKSPQPVIFSQTDVERCLPFTPTAVHVKLKEQHQACPPDDITPFQPLVLPLKPEVVSPKGLQPPIYFAPSSNPFEGLTNALSRPQAKPEDFSVGTLSSLSSSPLSPNGPPSTTTTAAAAFIRIPTSPSSPNFYFQTSHLKKSSSTLIMPSLLTLLRPESASSTASTTAQLPKDISSMSLSDPTSPPLVRVRKCHTMVSLSITANNAATTATTKVLKDKKPRFEFLRRISSSKSAVFTSTKSSPAFQTSMRKSPSASQTLQRYRKTSLNMRPHPEHPDEEEISSQGLGGGADVIKFSPMDRSVVESPLSEDKMAVGGCLRCASSVSIFSRRLSSTTNDAVFCKLCLTDVSIREMYQLQQCQCRFCTYCMSMYTTLKIREGESVIECPDSNCDCRGEIALDEVESLVGKELLNLHLKFRRNREIESDPLQTWCPKPGCDTVVSLAASKMDGKPQCCSCPTCGIIFCASCSSFWHSGKPCNRIPGQSGVPLNESIKRCPRCKVPIERDAGCAQMQCKKCKHVFCWYCLASLEDDFLLRHYDKGPCKNKLGHSRASVFWHRAQVVIIFAGFGLLLMIASPLLLFVGPCLLCRSCRPCSGTGSSNSSSSSHDSDEGSPGTM